MSQIPFLGIKIAITIALFVVTFVCSYLPWLIRLRFKQSSSVLMSYFNCLAGGVVLGALLMHMIPEIVEHHHHHGHKKKGTEHQHEFQYGPLCAGISFLLLFALDRLFLTHSHCEKARDSQEQNPHGPDEHKTAAKDVEAYPSDDHGSCHSSDVVGGCHMDGINPSTTRAQTFIFVLALSIHSFLEGLGLSSKSTPSNLALYLVSLFAHKWLEAFALGVSIMKAQFSSAHNFFLIAFYSVLTPLGIFCGIGLEEFFAHTFLSRKLIGQILNGLAVGSFLFVSCIEMIPPEFHKKSYHTPYKYVVLVVGFAAMAAISTI